MIFTSIWIIGAALFLICSAIYFVLGPTNFAEAELAIAAMCALLWPIIVVIYLYKFIKERHNKTKQGK